MKQVSELFYEWKQKAHCSSQMFHMRSSEQENCHYYVLVPMLGARQVQEVGRSRESVLEVPLPFLTERSRQEWYKILHWKSYCLEFFFLYLRGSFRDLLTFWLRCRFLESCHLFFLLRLDLSYARLFFPFPTGLYGLERLPKYHLKENQKWAITEHISIFKSYLFCLGGKPVTMITFCFLGHYGCRKGKGWGLGHCLILSQHPHRRYLSQHPSLCPLGS